MTSPEKRIQNIRQTLANARDELEREVLRMREAGASWQAVGAALGMSPQAAHRKYREKPPAVAELPGTEPLFGPPTPHPKD